MKAELGDTVTVLYDGFTENGELFDSSESTGPLEFIIGTGNVLLGFEENVIGMSEGETKSFTLKSKDAYGLSNPELIHSFDRQGIIDHDKIKIGMVLGLNHEHEGEQHKVPATVIAIDDSKITVDFNHPLSGQDLTYKVTLQSIVRKQVS